MIAVAVSLDIVPIGILIHAVIFLGVALWLSRTVLRPLARVRDARTDATVGRQERAGAAAVQADGLEQEYLSRVKTARESAQAEREMMRQRGVAEAAQVMQAARAETLAILEKARAEFAREVAAAQQVLQADAKEFTQLIMERIVEREMHQTAELEPSDEMRSVVNKGH